MNETTSNLGNISRTMKKIMKIVAKKRFKVPGNNQLGVGNVLTLY